MSPSPYSAIESVSLSGDCFSLPNLFEPPSLIKHTKQFIVFSIQILIYFLFEFINTYGCEYS